MSKLTDLIGTIDMQFSKADPVKVAVAEKSLTLGYEEMANFQTLKSLAQLKGFISLETAQFIYNALGHWDSQSVGTKFILTKLHADLIKAHLRGEF